eukprot:COSAG04_NODE_20705_length_388_cov_0.702422_2_plen_60_part_01
MLVRYVDVGHDEQDSDSDGDSQRCVCPSPRSARSARSALLARPLLAPHARRTARSAPVEL